MKHAHAIGLPVSSVISMFWSILMFCMFNSPEMAIRSLQDIRSRSESIRSPRPKPEPGPEPTEIFSDALQIDGVAYYI